MREYRHGQGALSGWQNCKLQYLEALWLSLLMTFQIDPKRAIPREEQERTAKIFVGGVSQEATEEEFKRFFMQFGRVIDATLMMDKDTGRPRGFGFVTFDGEAAVDATLAQPLEIHGKLIEVKRAQPRGNMRDDDQKEGKFGRGRGGGFGRGGGNEMGGDSNQQMMGGQGGDANGNGGMTPAMMAAYWQKMQQYFQVMQQQMAMGMGGGQPNPMMGQMNPAMMQQMMMAQNRGPGSPMGANGMNPAMMQQMQQMQQQQQQQQQMMQQQQQQPQQPPQQQQQGNGNQGFSPSPGPGMMNAPSGPAGVNRAGFTPGEQLAFEQRKYEEQQARRMQQSQFQQHGNQFNQGGTWDGMYDDVPAPAPPPSGPQRQGGGYRGGRGGGHHKANQQQQPNPNAPINAPTGPRNAGKPGANFRGGFQGAGRGGGRFHPYARG